MFAQIVAILGRVRSFLETPAGKRVGAVALAASFGLALFLAGRSLPDIERLAWWGPAFVALVGYPIQLVWMGSQYRMSAWLAGVDVPLAKAVPVAIVSAAANLLPLPGSIVVRTAALKREGVGLMSATASSSVVGLAWLAVSCLMSGIFVASIRLELALVAWLLAAAGAGLVWLGMKQTTRLGERSKALLRAAVLGLLMASTSAMNLWVMLNALGVDVSVAQTVAVSTSAVLATSLGFFPGGLGLREVLAGGIGAAVGMPAGVAVVGVLVIRIVSLSILLVASLIIGSRIRSGGSTP